MVGGQDEYACARAWVALTAAHARVSGLLASALARQCDLTINEFEILLRLAHAQGEARATAGECASRSCCPLSRSPSPP